MSVETTETNCGTFNADGVELTPWKATGKFTNEKYQKLIEKFGVQPLTDAHLERFERLTGQKPHRLLRRGLFFAHRQFDEILDAYEKSEPIFIYTGRGPTSDALHLGHIVPIEFTAWLQKVLNAFVIFQMADDEKRWFKDMEFKKVYELGRLNAIDVIALGYVPERTVIFSNRDQCREPDYQNVLFDIMHHARTKDVNSIFGLEETSSVGQVTWPLMQTVPAFAEAFSKIFGRKQYLCLVCYAIDQDPYFRLARDVAPKLGYKKPCSLMCQFLPALEGDSKMSSTQTSNQISSTVFMNDKLETIEKKIKTHAFSGGQDTLELHRKLGGNPDIDISYQWLRYFLEDDDKLAEIEHTYRSGELTTGELKKFTANIISDFVKAHQEAKSKITETDIDKFYDQNKHF